MTTLVVLLVEDDPGDSACFAAALRCCDPAAHLHSLGCSRTAMHQLASLNPAPQIVFVDLHLPGMPVREFAASLRAQGGTGRMLVVGLTGELACACAGATEYGLDALLVKPIAAEDLHGMLTLVRAVLR